MASTAELTDEQQRAAYLLDAQNKAAALFDEIGDRIVRAGIGEKAMSDEIHALGTERHHVRTHWHKRTVRSGPNTLQPYTENPPERTVQVDDILFVDLGPVFEEWEADFGRTFVLGNDAHKIAIRDALEPVWRAVKDCFDKNPDITGEQLYDTAREHASKAGYEFGGHIAGHIVGAFPHERIPQDKISLYITKGNQKIMRSLDAKGHKRHWILEIHLVDRAREIGAFMEQLLTVD